MRSALNHRVGLFCLLVLAGLATAAWAADMAGPEGIQGLPPGPVTEQARQEAAVRKAAAEAAQLAHVESSYLVTMARSLAPAPPQPGKPVMVTPWQLDRRIVLLEAAQRVAREQNPRAWLELYLARNDALTIYGQLAQQAEAAVARARLEGRTADVEGLTRAAARAAARVEQLRLGRTEALSHYVAANPSDIPAWRTLLDEKLSLKQSAPERIKALEAELAELKGRSPSATQPASGPARQPAPPEAISTVLALMADYHIRQGDAAKAKDLLGEAVGMMPLNRQAKAMLLALAGDKARPEEYLDLLLTDFRLNPVDMAAVDSLVGFLVRYGLYDLPLQVTVGGKVEERNYGAIGLLDYEADLRADLFKGEPPPDFLQHQGETLMLAGKDEQAVKVLRRAIDLAEGGGASTAADPAAKAPEMNLPARILLGEALAKSDAAASGAEAKKLSDYYAANKGKPGLADNAGALAWLAWFNVRAGNQPLAVELARNAAKLAPDEPRAQRSLGAALAGKPDTAKEAIGLLEPLARGGDAWAIYYLAAAQRQAGQAEQADKLLKALATSWPGHAAGRRAIGDLGASAPPAAPVSLMKDMLVNLPPELFAFYKSPGAFARVDVALDAGKQPYEPIAFFIRLANTSAPAGAQAASVLPGASSLNPIGGIPVTVGDGLMIWSNVLVSVSVLLPGETAPRTFRDYCQIRMPSPQILQPGQAVLTSETLDIGPVEQLLRLTPQAAKTVDFQFLLNPTASTSGTWIVGPGGYPIAGEFVRKPFVAGSESVQELITDSKRGSTAARLAANRMLGSLLAEQQLAAAKRLSYTPRSIAAYRLSDALETAAADPDPMVRAFVMDAVYPAGLGGKLREAAVKALADEDWLVRLLAVRLTADRLGPAIAQPLSDLAAKDPDPLVRQLAQTYLDDWSSQRPR